MDPDQNRLSLPIAWQLYLPESWCDGVERCQAAGVPESVHFATKPQMALEQIWRAKAAGIPVGIVVADAGYGNECMFREGLEVLVNPAFRGGSLGLKYAVGISHPTTVWAAGSEPIPAKPYGGIGKPATLLKRDANHQPVSVKALAMNLPSQAWRTITWREGSNTMLHSRFARVRARLAHRDIGLANYVTKCGCWRSGPKRHRSRPNTGYRICRPRSQSKLWWQRRRRVGGSNETMRN